MDILLFAFCVSKVAGVFYFPEILKFKADLPLLHWLSYYKVS